MDSQTMTAHLIEVRRRNENATGVELELAAGEAIRRAGDPSISRTARDVAQQESMALRSMIRERRTSVSAADQVQALRDAGEHGSADAMEYSLGERARRSREVEISGEIAELEAEPPGALRDNKLKKARESLDDVRGTATSHPHFERLNEAKRLQSESATLREQGQQLVHHGRNEEERRQGKDLMEQAEAARIKAYHMRRGPIIDGQGGDDDAA